MDFILSKLDPNTTLTLLVRHIQNLKDSLSSLTTITANWPELPSDTKEQPTGVNLNNYQQAFDTLKLLLTPEENSNFQQIVDLRKQVEKAKIEYKKLIDQKEKSGLDKCLAKAKEYRELLQQQRQLEYRYLETILHKWKTAVNTFETDLKQITAH